MEFLNDFNFGLYATIFGLISLAGGAAGYFKASRGDSIIKYQAVEIDALRRKIGDLEKEKLELEAEKKALEATCATKDDTITELQKNIKYLQKLGQGSPQLKKLTAAIENQTKIFTAWMEKQSGKEDKNNAA